MSPLQGPPNIVVVFIGGFPGETAGAHHVQRMCRGLQLQGWRPMVLSVGFSRSSSSDTRGGCEPRWGIPFQTAFLSPNRTPLHYMRLCQQASHSLRPMLVEQLRGNAVRAVIFTVATHFGYQPLFELCERAQVPVVSYETEYPEWKNWTGVVTGGYFDHLLYLRRTLPRAAGIIGISSFWAATAQRLGIPFVVVPSYLPDEVPAIMGESDSYRRQVSSSFHLVSLGLWVPRECPLVLLRAIRNAYMRGVPIRYTAIGRVGSTPLERTAMNMYRRDPVLCKVVRITGWVDEAQKEELLESANVFVILRRENRETAALFPTRLPEYLSHARPVIASSSGDLSRYLQHKKSAWLIPGDDDGSVLSEAMCELYNDPELAGAIGRGGLAQAINSFSIEENGRRMSAFINAVISSRMTGSG